MSANPAKGCHSRKGCAQSGKSANGKTSPEKRLVKPMRNEAARGVRTAVVTMLRRTVMADDNSAVRVIETTKRVAAVGLDGKRQRQSAISVSGRTRAASTNTGPARKLVLAARQASARANHKR